MLPTSSLSLFTCTFPLLRCMFVLAISFCVISWTPSFRYAVALYGNWDVSYLWEGVNRVPGLVLGANPAIAYVQFNPSLCEEDLSNLASKFNETEGNVGNSLTGICATQCQPFCTLGMRALLAVCIGGVNLLLTLGAVSAESVTVEWKSSNSSSPGPNSTTGYLLHYIRLVVLTDTAVTRESDRFVCVISDSLCRMDKLAVGSAHLYEKKQIYEWVKLQKSHIDFSW